MTIFVPTPLNQDDEDDMPPKQTDHRRKTSLHRCKAGAVPHQTESYNEAQLIPRTEKRDMNDHKFVLVEVRPQMLFSKVGRQEKLQ
ncbi:hypothetical protein [Rhodophyticola sp.]|jgi:hypothetical protein|uniref:hypothetical protein n=1 Tax=Rhodophyticola sp. TaxID=2680032 RepID=UPI003D283C39